MRYLCLLTLAVTGWAQPTLTLTTASPVYPGATINVAMTLSGSAGTNLAALGFTLNSGASAPVIGAASTAAGKTLWTSGQNVLLAGFTSATPPVATKTLYADGVVLTFSYQISSAFAFGSPVALAFNGLEAVDVNGVAIAPTTVPLSATVGANPQCITLINGAITSWLSTPTASVLSQIESDISAVFSGGTCK